MKNIQIIRVVVGFALLTSIVLGQEKVFTPQEQQLIDIVKTLKDAQTKDDTSIIQSLSTDEVIGIYGASIVNLMLAKQQIANKPNEIKPQGQGMRIRPLLRELTDFKVSLAGDTAVVMAKETIYTRAEGWNTTSRMQSISFLVQKDGKWKVAASQLVPLNHRSFPQSTPVVFEVQPLPERIKSLAWSKIAEDKQGDGLLGYAGDGKSLSYFYDKNMEMLWFRFELYDDIEKSHPAVSLAFDIDGDQKTGFYWWGKDSTFKYDKVLNLGVNEKVAETKVRGYNGVTSGNAAIDSNWLDEKKRNLIFHLSPEEKAYYLGVKRADLGAKVNKISVVGSVGANSNWNDDIGEGGAPLALPPLN